MYPIIRKVSARFLFVMKNNLIRDYRTRRGKYVYPGGCDGLFFVMKNNLIREIVVDHVGRYVYSIIRRV